MRIPTFFVLILLPALASCGGGKVYNQDYAAHYQFLELMANHGDKDMHLSVQGNPYGISGPALEDAVSAALSGRNHGLPIHFTGKAQTRATTPTRIEVFFSPPPGFLSFTACRSGRTYEASPDSSGVVAMIYCKRGKMLSAVQVALPENATPGSAAFNDGFALGIRELLPRVAPGEDGRECLNDEC